MCDFHVNSTTVVKVVIFIYLLILFVNFPLAEHAEPVPALLVNVNLATKPLDAGFDPTIDFSDDDSSDHFTGDQTVQSNGQESVAESVTEVRCELQFAVYYIQSKYFLPIMHDILYT